MIRFIIVFLPVVVGFSDKDDDINVNIVKHKISPTGIKFKNDVLRKKYLKTITSKSK